MNFTFIFIMIVAAILEYVGDSNFKLYARSSDNTYLSYGIVAYVAMIFVIIKVLKNYSNVMYMNGVWDAISIVLETTLAYIFLKEKLDNNYQLIGFILVVAGIVLMNIGNIPF